jgi:hypothetical protein
MKIHDLLLFLFFMPLFLFANVDTDELKLKLEPTKSSGTYRLTVVDKYTLWSGDVEISPNEVVCEELEKGLSFCGKLSKDGRVFRGFIKSGYMHYQVILTQTAKGDLEGNWNKLVAYEYPPTQQSPDFADAHFAGKKYW